MYFLMHSEAFLCSIETRCVFCGTADIDFITPYQDSLPSLYIYVIMSFFQGFPFITLNNWEVAIFEMSLYS